MTSKKAPAATTPNRKPLADYADATVTPLIQEYADWIATNTGVKVDPLSVFLSSALRTLFQAERREAKQTAAKPKRAPRRPSTKGSTVATAEGVVIAEQQHIEAVSE